MEDENTVSSVTYPPLIVTTNDLERELHRPKTLKDRFNLNFLKKYKYYDVMKMESDRDVEGLLDLIKYKDYDYKIWALRILGELKEPRSILPLILLLKKDDYLRDKVIDTLIKIGEPTVDPLIASLDLMDYNINWGAIKALGELKAERAINPLIKMLKYKDLNFQTSKALSQIGDKAVDLLIELLNDYDVNVQINAIYALSYIESPKAIEPLIELLEDDDADVRLVAYQALQRMSKKSKQRLKEVVPITQEFNEYLYNEKKTENYYERLIRLYMHEEKLLSDRTSIYLIFNSLLFAGFIQLYLKSLDNTLPSIITDNMFGIGFAICFIAIFMYFGQYAMSLDMIVNITNKKIGINVIERENFWYPGKEKLYRNISKYGLSPIGLSNIHKKVLSLVKDNSNIISIIMTSLVYLIWLVSLMVIISEQLVDNTYKSYITAPMILIGMGIYFVLLIGAYRKINSLSD